MLMPLQFKILENEIKYSGTELRSHWALEQTGIYGSLITAFIGPCEVKTDHLVDMEDRLASDFIRAEKMLHIIAELYGISLESGVLYQRLLMNHAEQILIKKGMKHLERIGDDLMLEDSKLSVSIATVTPTSILIHCGINIDSTGAPVKAVGLNKLGWKNQEVISFTRDWLTAFCNEVADIQKAQVKVRSVI